MWPPHNCWAGDRGVNGAPGAWNVTVARNAGSVRADGRWSALYTPSGRHVAGQVRSRRGRIGSAPGSARTPPAEQRTNTRVVRLSQNDPHVESPTCACHASGLCDWHVRAVHSLRTGSARSGLCDPSRRMREREGASASGWLMIIVSEMFAARRTGWSGWRRPFGRRMRRPEECDRKYAHAGRLAWVPPNGSRLSCGFAEEEFIPLIYAAGPASSAVSIRRTSATRADRCASRHLPDR